MNINEQSRYICIVSIFDKILSFCYENFEADLEQSIPTDTQFSVSSYKLLMGEHNNIHKLSIY